MIIVRKHIQERERGQLRFFPNCEYLFYITNDWTSQPAEIVFRQTIGATKRTWSLSSGPECVPLGPRLITC